MKAKPLPKQEVLQKLYDYNSDTGVLIGKRYGKIVGYKTGRGLYLMVNIKRKNYQIHRIIWRLMTGEDPGELVIDHINKDKLDNRWCNLRAITVGDNRSNHSQSCVCKHNGAFLAKVIFRKKLQIQKYFKTEAEAFKAVKAVREKCLAMI